VDDGRLTDTGRLCPVSGDVRRELGRPLHTLSGAPWRSAPPVQDLPWYPPYPATRGHQPSPISPAHRADPPTGATWWRISRFVRIGFITRLALFETREFGQPEQARRSAEQALHQVWQRSTTQSHSLACSVELRRGCYHGGRWAAGGPTTVAHLSTSTGRVSWSTPVLGRLAQLVRAPSADRDPQVQSRESVF
jgi:hypothetical protein